MAAPNILNATSIYGKSMGAALGTTDTTDILTCPAEKVIRIKSILVSNVDGLTMQQQQCIFMIVVHQLDMH